MKGTNLLLLLVVSSLCLSAAIAAQETCPADLGNKCDGGASDDWEGEFFPDIPKIKYEGPTSKNPLAYKWYNAEEVILGKKMKVLSVNLTFWLCSFSLYPFYTVEYSQLILCLLLGLDALQCCLLVPLQRLGPGRMAQIRWPWLREEAKAGAGSATLSMGLPQNPAIQF